MASARADPAEADLDLGLVDQLLRAIGGIQLIGSAAQASSPVSSFAVGARLLEVVERSRPDGRR